MNSDDGFDPIKSKQQYIESNKSAGDIKYNTHIIREKTISVNVLLK